jgi:adenine-specific DNA-methyltransferase
MTFLSEAEILRGRGDGRAAARRLAHVAELSCGRRQTGNMIIRGENLQVLEALSPEFAGRVRCIYIDPPYNNQEQYQHYADSLGHERWLAEVCARLERLAGFLTTDGSLWISIDDREVHYLKVAADRILGRENFVTTVVWQQRTTRENRKVFSNNHEYLLVYARDARAFKAARNLLDPTPEVAGRYRNPDRDPRGPWQSVSANVQAGHATPSQFYVLTSPNGRQHRPPQGRCWVYNQPRMEDEIVNNNVWFGRDGNGVPRLKRFLRGAAGGLTPATLWPAGEAGTNKDAKKHLLQMFPRQPVFDTPKPEALVRRVLHIATNPGDLVLDAYLGSGTTSAVAHKMCRRYVGIEQGAHAVTFCAGRMRQVVEGEAGGISRLVGWEGGGGFDFYTLQGESKGGAVSK